MALVEDMYVTTATVFEDQNDETLATNEQVTSKAMTLRWNFPTFGIMYLDTGDKNEVMQICQKESIFAGFWLESMFVSHHI